MTYSHRNGESMAPTVPGKYWFNGFCHGAIVTDLTPVIAEGDSLCAWRPVWDDGWYERIEQFVGQWWGPVTAPWEEKKR